MSRKGWKEGKKGTRGKGKQSPRRGGSSMRFTGRLQLTPSGYGFVTITGLGKDLFVPRGKLFGAFHNDLVEVEVSRKKKDGRISGKIISIKSRGIRKVIGRYFRNEEGRFLKVEDKKFSMVFAVTSSSVRKVKNGTIATGILEEGEGRKGGRRSVRIVETHGEDPTVSSLTSSSVYLKGLDKKFPRESETQLARLSARVQRNEKGRRDLTEYPFVTIDGFDARDFDDAVCLVNEGKKKRLLVSIADVSEYVPQGSPLDREARRRGTSAYFPDRVVPMFPERLSNDICSLRERVNRLTMTVDATLDETGEVVGVEFYPSVIKSRKRLTYREVEDLFQGKRGAVKRGEIVNMLFSMRDLATLLYEKRVEKGSLDFDLPEATVFLGKGGELEKIVKGERLFSHRLIEEFMLLANVCVARFLEERKAPFLYRNHEGPDPQKLVEALRFAKRLGISLPSGKLPGRRELNSLILAAKGKPHEKIVNMLILRSLALACYSPGNTGHFGLAFPVYTHFTSPIRRYPDLTVHRVLKKIICGERCGTSPSASSHLPKEGEYLSEREREAEQAERDVLDKVKALYMERHVGKEFRGIITTVQFFGFFVELEEIFIEGLVQIEDLPRDTYYLEEGGYSLRGSVGGEVYSVGSPVTVKVKGCDPFKGRIDFLLVEKSP